MITIRKIKVHQCINPPYIVDKDCNPVDPFGSSPLYKLFEMDFSVKMIRILNKLKEAMKCTDREIRNKNEKKIQT